MAIETEAGTAAERAGYKEGKIMLELVDLDFVVDMARQFTAGLKGERVPNGWHKLDPTKWRELCAGAALRHMAEARRELGAVDPETGATHWAAVAVNAMMCWWFERSMAGAEPRAAPVGCATPSCANRRTTGERYCTSCLVLPKAG